MDQENMNYLVAMMERYGDKKKIEMVHARRCVECEAPISEDMFKDRISLISYYSCGLCQICQNKIFAKK